MSKFYILEERELFDHNDMSEFAVEFDGDLREFVKEKIKSDKNVQVDPKNLEYNPSCNFHDWCAERELKTLDNAWECEIQDIYEKFFNAHRYTVGAENKIKHKEYLDGVERTLNEELEAVNKAYEEKRKKVKAKFFGKYE